VMDNSDNEVFFHGIIDDIKVFNYGLTEQEINELFLQGANDFKR